MRCPSRGYYRFPTYAQIDANTSLSEHDISSIIAINCRSQQQPNKGAEFVRGGLRYPGEAVAIAHAYDEGL